MSYEDDFKHFKIQLKDIMAATNDFGDKPIGSGGFGDVYKGELVLQKGARMVAFKRLNRKFGQGDVEFWKEIILLSELKHKNLATLLHFCNEDEERILVYKYASRGSLDKYLGDASLTWTQRLDICLGAARGIAYLHDPKKTQQRVLHRDIKSSNILLDDKWTAKVSDFGLSKVGPANQARTYLVSNICGTPGYCDPMYFETGILSKECDVYSFGVVLFEVMCGRLCCMYDKGKLIGILVQNWRNCYTENRLYDIIFPDIKEQINQESLLTFAAIANKCLNRVHKKRPHMVEIIKELEAAIHQQNVRKETKSLLKYLPHLKLNGHDLASATNNFAVENIIEMFKIGGVFKGRLLHSEQFIDIILKRFYVEYVEYESKRFWTEVSMLSSLEHKNLVSVIGFYDDEEDKTIVYKKEANESLNKYLSDQTLTWMQRLKICVGVAKAFSYIHYDAGRDFSVIHCNVRSSKILLDDKWEPKLSGFELSLKNTVARRLRLLLTRDINKKAYLDPKYRKTGGVTHKSDVYSFGVVLFEVLCGRRADDEDEDEDEDKDESEGELGEGLLSQLAKSHLDDMIDPHLRKQMDPEAFRIFSDTAYWCIEEERADRPYIDQVVIRLEKALELQHNHENPVKRTSSIQLKENLEHLKIGLDLINEATKNFDDTYCIGSGGFGKVYKADLEHFDSSNSLSIEGVDKCDLPRKRSTVAIKRIKNQGQQGFIAEIETLTSCKHENIISLLGFCYEGNGAMILVYEHASKGSLESYLGRSDKMANLNWLQRLNIRLDIAHGLNYIHNNTNHGKQKMIHRDIKSDNILLGDSWKAKIADFGLSKFHPADQTASTIYTNMVAGTYVYLDPEYEMYGKLHKKSDIYSFGVVLLEILSGRLAYDSVYTKVNKKGIALVAKDLFKKGRVMEIVDQKIKEETDEHVFSLSKGLDKESLDVFLDITFRCVAETQAQRPTIEVVINELKKALDSRENHKDNLKLSLEDIKLATKGFSQDNIIGHGDSGNVYKGATHSTHGDNIIAAKRFDKNSEKGDADVLTELAAKFMAELDILMMYKHLNVIDLLGYCDEC